MGKKRAKREPESADIFGLKLSNISLEKLKKDFLIIAAVSILAKFLMVFATTNIFGSFVDLFDISYYFKYAAMVAQGQMPYIDFSVPYPVLFLIPALLPLPFSLLTQDAMTYVFVYQFFMAIVDVIIAFLVYLIVLYLADSKRAFNAGILYATAFSAAYFAITKYDAFPVLFLMLGLMLTIYGAARGGYISIVLGFFTKLFPLLSLPYTFLYNSEKTSLRDEIISLLKCSVPIFLILLVPALIISPDSISAYLSAAGGGLGVYVNTPTYTIHALLLSAGLDISSETISIAMYIAMAAVILFLLAAAYSKKIENPDNLLIFVFLTIFATIFFSKFHSPQYILWITPLIAVFLSGELRSMILFYIFQVLSYVEFPLMYNKFYINAEYTSLPGTAGWYMTLLFFTAEYIFMLYLIYRITAGNDKFRVKMLSVMPKK